MWQIYISLQAALTRLGLRNKPLRLAGIREEAERVPLFAAAWQATLARSFTGTQRSLQVSSPNGQPRTITVKIPAGVDNGSRVRVAGVRALRLRPG